MSLAMSLADIQAFVRDALDVDTTDLTDAVLNVFIQDGFDKIIGYFDGSPVFYQVEYPFTSNPAQQSYSLDTDLPTTPTPLQSVTDVRGETWSLRPADHRQIRAVYRESSPQSSRPTEFSLWGRNLFLWPIPDTAAQFFVTGIRQPADWITSAGSPDCPADFHNLIAMWALGRGYMQQDDIYTGSFLRDEFYTELANRANRYAHGNDAQPLLINSTRKPDKWRTERVLGPLIYDFE